MVKRNWIRADIDAHSINRKHAKENIQYVLDAKERDLNSLREYVFNWTEDHGQFSQRKKRRVEVRCWKLD